MAATATHMTIDELARLTGTTTRNIRAYQTRGLLRPPDVRGRRGLYGEEHVARLRLIRDMQAAGFNLRAIKRLLELVPAGAAEEAVRLERALLAPWVTEEPEIVDGAELAARFPQAGEGDLRRARELGLITPLDDGRIRLESPTLLRAGEEVVRLGVPPAEALEVLETVRAHAEGVARAFVSLFLERVWEPHVADDPSSGIPRIREALERLRPIASSVLTATFQRVMAAEVEAAVGDQLTRR
ncbi:MAG TPA: MerR family transcriptional regulator [Actinomycetota bacterium]|nr:MerR family transcriptional regulator [Actinomycetota bacterium]